MFYIFFKDRALSLLSLYPSPSVRVKGTDQGLGRNDCSDVTIPTRRSQSEVRSLSGCDNLLEAVC